MANKRFNQITRVVTSFDSNDVLPIGNGTLGDGKMSKDTLLELTAQNALAGNVAPAFIPSDKPNPTTTVAGQPYVYGGLLYEAKVSGYQGPWDSSKFTAVSIKDFLNRLDKISDPIYKLNAFRDRTNSLKYLPITASGVSGTSAEIFSIPVEPSSSIRVTGTCDADGVSIVLAKVTAGVVSVFYEGTRLTAGSFDVFINVRDAIGSADLSGCDYLYMSFQVKEPSADFSAEVNGVYVDCALFHKENTDALVMAPYNKLTHLYDRYGTKIEFPFSKTTVSSAESIMSFHVTPDSSVRFVGTTNKGLALYLTTFAGGVATANSIKTISAGSFDLTINIRTDIPNVLTKFKDVDSALLVLFAPQSATETTISNLYVSNDLKLLYDLLEVQDSVPDLDGIMDIGDNETKGFDSTTNIDAGWAGNQSKYMLTVKGSTDADEMLLTKIKIKVLNAGKYRFFQGFIDQNDYISLSEPPFDLDLDEGVNEVDVSDLGIALKPNYNLFVYTNYHEVGEDTYTGVPYKNMNSDTSYLDHEALVATSFSDKVHRFNVTGGFVIYFAWECKSFESILVTKGELKIVEENVAINSAEINSMKTIKGANGISYKIGVDVNGNIVAYPMQFSNALCIGNSLTDHAPSPSIGYYGDGWPMAASCLETGWVYELQEIFKEKIPSAVVGKIGGTTISAFERNPQNYVTDSDFDAIMGDYVGADLDLIIYKAGENVYSSMATAYKAGLKRFVNYLKRKYTSAQIFIAQPFYAGGVAAQAAYEVAAEENVDYIADPTSTNYRQRLGMYTFGDDNEEYPIIQSAVASHLDDVGFLLWANRLASFFGYTELDWLKSVSISASGVDYAVNRSQCVKGGLYTILIYGSQPTSISVVDESDNAVQYTLHDMSSVEWINEPSTVPDYAITFVVPNSDVSVTLS